MAGMFLQVLITHDKLTAVSEACSWIFPEFLGSSTYNVELPFFHNKHVHFLNLYWKQVDIISCVISYFWLIPRWKPLRRILVDFFRLEFTAAFTKETLNLHNYRKAISQFPSATLSCRSTGKIIARTRDSCLSSICKASRVWRSLGYF